MAKKNNNNFSFCISAALLIFLGFCAWAGSLDGEFIWDDEVLITKNIYIKNWANIGDIFSKNTDAGAGESSQFYRPVLMLSYMINYSFFGLNPRGYHSVNIFLHIIVALLIFWLINIIFKDNLFALITSSFFIIHPVHSEVVSYISGRSSALAAIFILTSFIFYIKQAEFPKKVFFISLILSYILALLSREVSLVFPLLIAVYCYSFGKKVNRSSFISILIITFFYIILRLTVLKFVVFNEVTASTTFLQRLPGFFAALVRYFQILLFPLDLHMEYGAGLFSFANYRVVLGIVLVLFLLFLFLRVKKVDKLFVFSISWFFVILLPQSNFYPINAYMSEHWLYLPSVGYFMILSCGLTKLFRNRRLRILALAVILILLNFYLYLAIKQNSYWRDSVTFYQRTLEYSPNSVRIYNNLGVIYNNLGKHQEAIPLFKKAIEIKPKYVSAYNNLGVTYQILGEYSISMEYYLKVLDMDDGFAEVYGNIGSLYAILGNYREAKVNFLKSKKLFQNKDDIQGVRNAQKYLDKLVIDDKVENGRLR